LGPAGAGRGPNIVMKASLAVWSGSTLRAARAMISAPSMADMNSAARASARAGS
jgi:hypothetical protein